MKIIEKHVVTYGALYSSSCFCDDDCNNCWERCNVNDGDCTPDCDNCSDFFCRDYL